MCYVFLFGTSNKILAGMLACTLAWKDGLRKVQYLLFNIYLVFYEKLQELDKHIML